MPLTEAPSAVTPILRIPYQGTTHRVLDLTCPIPAAVALERQRSVPETSAILYQIVSDD